MKLLAFLVEPANYTLDLVDNIYAPRDVRVVFARCASLAAKQGVAGGALENSNLVSRMFLVSRYLRDYDAFIVNGYSNLTMVMVLFLNLIYRKPMAIESDTELCLPRNLLKRLAKWLWLSLIFKRKWCYGFPGGGFGHYKLFSHYGMQPDRIRIMPMVVDNRRYLRIGPRRDDSAFRFGYLGRLVDVKQVFEMLLAVDELSKKHVFEFHVIGDGELREKLIAKFGNNEMIVFHGALFGNEKVEVLQSLDALVLFSRFEPWGLVVNEAMAAGVPCIVSDRVGSRHELIEPKDGMGETGIVVSWNSREELAYAMKEMIYNRSRYDEFVCNAKLRMKQWNYDYYGRQFDGWARSVGG